MRRSIVARYVNILIVMICLLGLPAAVAAQAIVVAHNAIVLPPQGLPELPEPAVLAMMLLGICVIGYRVRRDSQETFR